LLLLLLLVACSCSSPKPLLLLLKWLQLGFLGVKGNRTCHFLLWLHDIELLKSLLVMVVLLRWGLCCCFVLLLPLRFCQPGWNFLLEPHGSIGGAIVITVVEMSSRAGS
jgi:hypothetical protein